MPLLIFRIALSEAEMESEETSIQEEKRRQEDGNSGGEMGNMEYVANGRSFLTRIWKKQVRWKKKLNKK
jgi:hypothetical protein